MAHENLRSAKRNRADEFWTLLPYIESELEKYSDHFKGKVVICNCDDPKQSNFVKYFMLKFHSLGLKRLISTCYKSQNPELFSNKDSEHSVYMIYDGEWKGTEPDYDAMKIYPLKGDGDFRSEKCINLLKMSDICVSNPPFSLFIPYIKQLIEYNKKFLIIGRQSALHYQDVFPLIKDNKLSEMEADHIKPWSRGGKTELSNCQMLCRFHNNEKKAKW